MQYYEGRKGEMNQSAPRSVTLTPGLVSQTQATHTLCSVGFVHNFITNDLQTIKTITPLTTVK